ncbi:MAG: putative O-glycosylation ligase, exosortase A system-associated [Dongiaceae bacterium]
MRDLFLLLIFLGYLRLALKAPFVMGLGYIWVDLFNPQGVSFGLLSGRPLSLVMGLASLLAYLVLDRRNPPRFAIGLVLLSCFAVWVTMTTTWAVVPEEAWIKWDWAIKVLIFAIFLPYIIRTETQLEAMLLTVIFSIGGSLMSFAVKTVVSGGGYDWSLGLSSGSTLVEGSTLSATAVSLVPLILFFARDSRLLPQHWSARLFMYGLAAAGLVTAVGSFARTGLIALATFAGLTWLRSRRKIALAAAFGLALAVGPQLAGENWAARMSTIAQYDEEGSALGRIAVWIWTLQFVAEHPLGGGFGAYRINRIDMPMGDGSGQILEVQAKAFHSIYFEVLGEHGVVGFALLMLMLAVMFANLFRVWRSGRRQPELRWRSRLAAALMTSAAIYLVGGAFIGVAFQPYLYYLMDAGIVLAAMKARRPAAPPAAAAASRPAILDYGAMASPRRPASRYAADAGS